jgi:hypothetical protein
VRLAIKEQAGAVIEVNERYCNSRESDTVQSYRAWDRGSRHTTISSSPTTKTNAYKEQNGKAYPHVLLETVAQMQERIGELIKLGAPRYHAILTGLSSQQ